MKREYCPYIGFKGERCPLCDCEKGQATWPKTAGRPHPIIDTHLGDIPNDDAD